MADTCTTAKRNLGKSKCNKLPKLFKRMITTPDNFKLTPENFASASALKTALQALIKNPINSRGYLWPNFVKVDPLSEEATYEDTPLNLQPVRDGQYRWRFHISKNMYLHKAMHSHRAINEGRVFLVDLDNQLFGMEDESGNIMGFSIGMLHTEKLMISDGSTNTTSPIYVCLADNEEIDKSGVVIDGSVIRTVDPLTDVSITLADGDAFDDEGFMVDVKQTSDGVPVSGLLLADFIFYAADGITTQTISSATEDSNVPGRYNLVPDSTFASGTVTLRAPSALTAAVGAYEVDEPLTATIS